MKRIAAKLFVIGGLAALGVVVPRQARATMPQYSRCVWYNNGNGCFKGCDSWVFTQCATDGSQGCYSNGSGC